MTKVQGRANCNINKDWKVRLNVLGGDNLYLTVAEQLTEEEATIVYNKIKAQMESKKEVIEIETDGYYSGFFDTECFQTRNIVSVEMQRPQ